MDRLSSSGQDSAPLDVTGDTILELTAEQINAKREQGELGDFVAMVERWFTTCRNVRAMEERQWFKNVDMYQGRQFTIWDKSKQRMVEIPNLDYNIRLSVNIVEPIARTEMTKTGKNMPIATVSPASNDLQDLMAAEAAEAVVDWWFNEMQFQTRVFTPANWWRTVTGVGFVKVFWDASQPDIAAEMAKQQQAAADAAAQKAALAGNVAMLYPGSGGAPMPPTAQPPAGFGQMPPAPGAPEQQPATPAGQITDPGAKPGRVDAYSVSPFHLYIPDPAELDLQRQPYIIHVYTIPVEKARLRYGDRLPQGWSPSPINPTTIVDLSRLGILGAAATQPDSVLVKECWIKPGYSEQFPDGGLIITCADEVVHLAQSGMPYGHGQYPFAMITGIENGKFYRKSIVESVTPLQNELNQTVSQIVKRKNLMSAPQMFYDEGSVDPRRITNKPGQWIPIRLGMSKPQPVQVTETPSYVLDLLNRIRQFTNDISGQNQVTSVAGANTPASAISLLQEQEDDFQASALQSIDAAMQTIGRHVLQLAVQFWDEPRLIKITGRETAFDVRQLTGADLTNGTDLRMESMSGLPMSKTAKIATITDWMEKGFIPPAVGMAAIEMGALGRAYRQIRLDQDQAQRENIDIRDLDVAEVQAFYDQQDQAAAEQQAQAAAAQMAQQHVAAQAVMTGQPAAMPAPAPEPAPTPGFYPIGWQDNDPAHIQSHKDYAKGQAFRNWDPVLQRVLADHVRDHEQRDAQNAMAAAQTQGEQVGATMKAEGMAPGQYMMDQKETLTPAS